MNWEVLSCKTLECPQVSLASQQQTYGRETTTGNTFAVRWLQVSQTHVQVCLIKCIIFSQESRCCVSTMYNVPRSANAKHDFIFTFFFYRIYKEDLLWCIPVFFWCGFIHLVGFLAVILLFLLKIFSSDKRWQAYCSSPRISY